jgi:hypothetical protein
MITRCRLPFALGATFVGSLFLALNAAVSGQDPAQRSAQLKDLRAREARILEERAWWLAVLDDPERLLLPRIDQDPANPEWPMPMVVRRSDAIELIAHWTLLHAVTSRQQFSHSRSLAEFANLSVELKRQYREELLPSIDDELQRVRQQAQSLAGDPSRPDQVAPPGRAWYFRRAIVRPTTEPTLAGFELLDSEAGPNGGYVLVKYRVSRDCDETYKMTWTFGSDVSRLRAETRIPVTLTVKLIGKSCNSGLGSTLGLASPPVENFLIREAPSNQHEWGAFSPQDARAMALGNGPHEGTTTTSIVVNHDPKSSNGWALFRLYVYVPGQFVTIGYLYLAGGS